MTVAGGTATGAGGLDAAAQTVSGGSLAVHAGATVSAGGGLVLLRRRLGP